MSYPDRVVFDAEPLVAFADDEPGSETVADYLEAVVLGDSDGIVNLVNATEVRYILARKYDDDTAGTFLGWLWSVGVTSFDAEPVWEVAADYVVNHNPALGDAYALATAEQLDATLVVGGDDDYEDVKTVAVDRFRGHGV